MKTRLRWIAWGLATGAAAAADPDSKSLAVWQDETFQAHFLGSYGVRSDIEPRVTEIERKIMERVMQLMALEEEGPDQAQAFLESQTKPASSAMFDFTMANFHFQKEDMDAAAEWYESAIAKFPAYQRAHKNLGLLYVRQQRFDKAVAPLIRAIELGAVDGFSYGILAYAHAMNGNYTAADGAYRLALTMQPGLLDWKLGLARCLFKQLKYEEAATLCEELIRREPQKADYWLLLANAFIGMKQPLKAAGLYEILDLDGRAPAASLHTLGDIYVNESLYDLAADAYARAMRKDDRAPAERILRNVEILLARGAHDESGRLAKALTDTMAGRLTDDDRRRLLKVEARLAAARGAPDEQQVKLLEEIVKLDPLDGEALILLGQHHVRAGRVEPAIFLFERAAGLERFEAEAKLRHAQCLVRNGRFQDAVPLLKRALELRPREDVGRYLEQVERAARSRATGS